MRLPVQAPFHLEATVRVLQRRPSNLIDSWDGERYQRAVRIAGRPLLLQVQNQGTIDEPDVRLLVQGSEAPAHARVAAGRLASAILGLDQDAALCEGCAAAERNLMGSARALRGMRAPRYPDLFETFANVIPFQQLSVEAGMAVVARLIQRFGRAITQHGNHFHVFPTAEVVADARVLSLRQCGMSLRKAQTLSSIAKYIASGTLTAESIETLPSPEGIDRLTQFSGIGAWSAALVLLRGFRRLDVFPPGDSGAERSLMALMRLRSPTSLAHIVDRFGDCRGLLYLYGIASRALEAGLIRPAPIESIPSATHARAF
jgi:3-methyladenine DNA glycosylase/8-oxoguanine DNA glycosylase